MRRCLSVVLAFLLPFAAWARAHSSSTSYVTIIASGHDARLQWSIALRDLDTAIVLDANDDGDITWGELRARQSQVDAYALSRLHLSTGGADCIAGPVEHLADLLGDGGYAVLRTALRCPVAIAGLDVRYGALFEIDPNHRALLNVTVEGVPHTGIASPSEPIAHFDASGGQFTLVRQFFQGGIEHLLAGADHVLFIVMLLAPLLLRPRPAAEGPLPRLAEIVTLLTAFTVAHGLTLTLAVLGLAHVSPAAAELGVASTILVTAARLAEVVFVTHSTLDPARAFRLDLRARGARFGRNPDEIKVLPGVVPIIGETTEEAEELRGLLESLSHSEAGLSTLSYLSAWICPVYRRTRCFPKPWMSRASKAITAKLRNSHGVPACRSLRWANSTAPAVPHAVLPVPLAPWRTGCRNGGKPGPATGSCCRSLISLAGWNASYGCLYRNCNDAGCFARNTPARRYAIISD